MTGRRAAVVLPALVQPHIPRAAQRPAGRRSVWSPPSSAVTAQPELSRRPHEIDCPAQETDVRLAGNLLSVSKACAARYVYDPAWGSERARLASLEANLDPGTTRLLHELGVGAGWRCLEVGAGGGSIARWLCERVGPAGNVVATDLDVRFLETLDFPQLEVRRHDIVNDELEEGRYDLVHSRAPLEHLPERTAALGKMVAALSPGGRILVEDVDFQFCICALPEQAVVVPSSQAVLMARVMGAIERAMRTAGIDPEYGRRLAAELFRLGLVDVGAESRARLIRGASAQAEITTLSLTRLRDGLVATDLVSSQDVDHAIALFGDPSFAVMSPTQVAAWGRRPHE